MKIEGGFQVSNYFYRLKKLVDRSFQHFNTKGRTNKLVDGCYSFWQGGVFPLIYLALKEQGILIEVTFRYLDYHVTVM